MTITQPIAVISIGSNDIHLLVASSDGVSTFARQENQAMLAELVSSVKGGVLPVKALAEALRDIESLVKVARSAEAATIIAIATQALRIAANGPAFLELVKSTIGIEAVLISGQEEAALDYCWATFPPVPAGPLLVIDSGGGSTQVIQGAGSAQRAPASAISLPVGAGNMTKQFLEHDPPEKEEIAALREHIDTLVASLPTILPPNGAVLMGGSADHLLQFAPNPQNHLVTHDDLHNALRELQKKPARDIAHTLDLPIERARLLPAGAVILLRTLSHFNLEQAHIKPNGIRGGLVVTYARHGNNWRQNLPLPPA